MELKKQELLSACIQVIKPVKEHTSNKACQGACERARMEASAMCLAPVC